MNIFEGIDWKFLHGRLDIYEKKKHSSVKTIHTLNIFKKVTSLHIKKINEKNTFLALTYSKKKDFFKI
jgi:hypothetical protein